MNVSAQKHSACTIGKKPEIGFVLLKWPFPSPTFLLSAWKVLLSAFCSDFRGHFSVDFKSLWGGGRGYGVPETLHICLGWGYRGVFLCKEII